MMFLMVARAIELVIIRIYDIPHKVLIFRPQLRANHWTAPLL